MDVTTNLDILNAIKDLSEQIRLLTAMLRTTEPPKDYKVPYGWSTHTYRKPDMSHLRYWETDRGWIVENKRYR